MAAPPMRRGLGSGKNASALLRLLSTLLHSSCHGCLVLEETVLLLLLKGGYRCLGLQDFCVGVL